MALLAVASLIFCIFILLLVRSDVILDTMYIEDSIFILNGAWNVWSGYVPNIDFTDRYGGLLTRVVALCFSFGGPSAKALDYTFALCYAVAVALLMGVGRKRLSPPLLFGAFLIVTALMVAKTPLETPYYFTASVSHAMFYNRIAWVLLFLSFLVAALPARNGREWPAVALAGALFLPMALTKLSFSVGLIPIVAAFLITGRRRALLIWAAGLLVSAGLLWVTLDIGPMQFLQIAGALGEAAAPQLSTLLLPVGKAAAVFVRGLFPFLAVLFIAAIYLVFRGSKAVASITAILLFLAVAIGITLTTGLFWMRSADTPAFAMAAVVLGEIMRREKVLMPATWFPIFMTIGIFAMPYMVNSMSAALQETGAARLRLIDHGPLQNYAVAPRDTPPLDGLTEDNLERLLDRLRGHRVRSSLNAQDRYIILAEDVRAIETLPNYKSLGVLSSGARLFPFALASRPVMSVDAWPTEAQLARLEREQLPTDIDAIVLVRDDVLDGPQSALFRLAQRSFTLCKRTIFSDIYLRRPLLSTATGTACNSVLDQRRHPGSAQS